MRIPGFRLIDMIVAVFVVAILAGLFLPALDRGHGHGRRTQCANDMRQIGLGLVQFSVAKNRFPNAGTFHDDPKHNEGDPLRSSIYQAIVDPSTFTLADNPCLHSWAVDIQPYIDNQELFNAWNFSKSYLDDSKTDPKMPTNAVIAATSIGILRCPQDPTAISAQGNLSYVVNGGFARWHAVPIGWDGGRPDGKPANDGVLTWAPPGSSWIKTQAVVHRLGVMSLGTDTGDQPWDVKTRPDDITDGASTTLLLGENTLAGVSQGTPYSGGLPTNWACPLPNFAMFLASDDVCQTLKSPNDCLGGQLARTSQCLTGPGWVLANHMGNGEGINDAPEKAIEGSFPFVNGNHSDVIGGANFVFCDGSVRFLRASINGDVYARLITPSGEKLPEALRQSSLSAAEIPD